MAKENRFSLTKITLTPKACKIVCIVFTVLLLAAMVGASEVNLRGDSGGHGGSHGESGGGFGGEDVTESSDSHDSSYSEGSVSHGTDSVGSSTSESETISDPNLQSSSRPSSSG